MKSLKAKLLAIVCAVLLCGLSSDSLVIGAAQRTSNRRPTEAWRRQAPKSETPRPFTLPTRRNVKLDNGLTLVLIEDHKTPLVTVLVGIPTQIVPSQNIADLIVQVALAEATAELITEGTGSRTSEEVAREVETLGGRLSSS